MKRIFGWLQGLALLALTACGGLGGLGGEFEGSPYFENPPSGILFSDKELFNQALSLQYKGQLKPAIGLWEKFLIEHPNAYEGLNNLGMAYYSNDQLDKSIGSFDSALTLEPSSDRIKKNLKRTLRFRVTLSRENHDYKSAIRDLQKISNLSNPDQKEKILREIEDMQEHIFAEVQKVNTVEEYQRFLETYPEGFYANKAREKLRELSPQAEGAAAPEKPKEFLPPVQPAQDMAKAEAPETPPTKEAAAEAPAPAPAMPMMEQPIEPKAEAPKEMDGHSMHSPAPEKPAAPAEPKADVKPASTPELKKLVRIVTRSSVLNVRAEPSLKAQVVGKLKKDSEIWTIGENADWYHVTYDPGKFGWIIKKFTEEVKK